jgi:hypothetical protein
VTAHSATNAPCTRNQISIIVRRTRNFWGWPVPHYGNTPIEIVEEVERVRRCVNGGPFTVRGVNRAGFLEVSVVIPLHHWDGLLGWQLALFCMRRIWQCYRNDLITRFVLRRDDAR